MKRTIVACLLLAGVGSPTSVYGNLTFWTQDTITGSGVGGTFTVNSPTEAVFHDDERSDGRGVLFSGSNDVNHILHVDVTVCTGCFPDDDFFGFVVGYSDGDYANAAANYVLVDWKQSDQAPAPRFGVASLAREGLALSTVTGSVAGTSPGSGYVWGHTGPVCEQMRGSTMGTVGWNDLQTYTFDIWYLPGRVQVFVNGVMELDCAVGISTGSFGLYGFSQDQVEFSSLSVSPVIPAPAAALLAASGVGVVGWLRKRKAL